MNEWNTVYSQQKRGSHSMPTSVGVAWYWSQRACDQSESLSNWTWGCCHIEAVLIVFESERVTVSRGVVVSHCPIPKHHSMNLSSTSRESVSFRHRPFPYSLPMNTLFYRPRSYILRPRTRCKHSLSRQITGTHSHFVTKRYRGNVHRNRSKNASPAEPLGTQK